MKSDIRLFLKINNTFRVKIYIYISLIFYKHIKSDNLTNQRTVSNRLRKSITENEGKKKKRFHYMCIPVPKKLS